MERVHAIIKQVIVIASLRSFLVSTAPTVAVPSIQILMVLNAMGMVTASKALMSVGSGLEYANALMAGLARAAMSIMVPPLKLSLQLHPRSGQHHTQCLKDHTSQVLANTLSLALKVTQRAAKEVSVMLGTKVVWTHNLGATSMVKSAVISHLRPGHVALITMLASIL